jgi:rubrerythrin
VISESSACAGKVRYLTRNDARGARKRMRNVKGKLNAYVCAYCGFYHLGHMPKAVRNGVLAKSDWRVPR